MGHLSSHARVRLLEELHKRKHASRGQRHLAYLGRQFHQALDAVGSSRIEVVRSHGGTQANDDHILGRFARRVGRFLGLQARHDGVVVDGWDARKVETTSTSSNVMLYLVPTVPLLTKVQSP